MKLRIIAFTTALAAGLSAPSVYAADSTTTNPAPSAMDRAGAKIGNEIDEAAGVNKPITAEELAGAVPLSNIADPAQSLATAQIKNAAGEAVGTVSSVDVTPTGKAKAIHADVGGFLGMGEHRVALKADKLVYLKARNLLVTRLSKAEIKSLPEEAPPRG